MRILRRWTESRTATIGFLRTGKKDREALAVPEAVFMLTLWSLADQPFCFRRRGDFLHIGLVKESARGQNRSRTRRGSR